MVNLNRVRFVALTPYLLVEMLKAGELHYTVVKDALPDDAEFVRCGTDAMGMVYLVVASNEFDELEKDARLPEIRPQLRKL
jgi:hypothetical protein